MKLRDHLNKTVKLAEDQVIYYTDAAIRAWNLGAYRGSYYLPESILNDILSEHQARYAREPRGYEPVINIARQWHQSFLRQNGHAILTYDQLAKFSNPSLNNHGIRKNHEHYLITDRREGNGTYESHMDHYITNGIKGYLSEIESILDTMSEITSYKSKAQTQASKNAAIQKQITEAQQKMAESSRSLQIVRSAVDSFNIKDITASKSPQQKSHILQKIWGSNNLDDLDVIKSIVDTGFDPHYVSKDGTSFVNIALTKNDGELFDLLIAKKINFNKVVNQKPIFQLILESGNRVFIDKMFTTGQDFTESIMGMALKDEANSLAIAFSYKAELAGTTKYGCPLLQLSLEKGCYRSAEQILKSYPGAINQLNTSNRLSPLAVMILKNNGQGVDLLRSYGADIALEVKKAITGGYVTYFSKILASCPDVITKEYDGLPLGHLVVERGNNHLLSKLLELKPEFADSIDSEGRTLLYCALLNNKPLEAQLLIDNGANVKLTIAKAIAENNPKIITDLATLSPEALNITIDGKTIIHIALEQDKVDFATSLIPLGDNIPTVKSALTHNQIIIARKLITLDQFLLAKLSQVENISITQALLRDPEFIKITDGANNSLLHLACRSGNTELAEILLATNPDLVNQQNSNNQTPLHILLESSIAHPIKSQIAEVILKLHPDISLKDSHDQTTQDLAICSAEILTMFYDLNLLGANEGEGIFDL